MKRISIAISGIALLAFAACTTHPDHGDRQASVIEQVFQAAKEPVPGTLDTEGEVYRLTVLPTFHNPFIARVDIRREGDAVVSIKVLSGKGGYKAGALRKTIRTPITKEDTVRLRSLVNRFEPRWQQTPLIPIGCDGSIWSFERVAGTNKHSIARWTPGHKCTESEFRELKRQFPERMQEVRYDEYTDSCRYLLELQEELFRLTGADQDKSIEVY